MIKHGLEDIDIYNPIKDKLPQIIEYFVKFYGEEYRERITQRLNDTIFIFTDRVSDTQLTPVGDYFYLKKRELLDKFQETVKDKTGVKLNFAAENIDEGIFMLEKIKDGINEKIVNRVYEFLMHFKSAKFNFSSPGHLRAFISDEKSAEELYKTFNEIYDIYQNEFKADFEYLEKENRRIQKFDNEDFKDMLKRLDRHFYQKSENAIIAELGVMLHIPPVDENIDKLAFYVPMIIDFLEIENYDRVPPISAIIFEHMFKEIADMSTLTVSVAGNKSERAKIAYVVEKVEGLRDLISLYRDEEFLGMLATRAGMTDRLNHICKDFVLGNDCVGAVQEFILSRRPNQGGFNLTTVPYSQPNKVTNICVNLSYLLLDDESAIHEMNHAILSSANFKNHRLFHKTGLRWQYLMINSEGEGNQTFSNYNRYNAIDEVINEYFAQRVVGIIRQDDFRIGYKDGADVLYRGGFPLLQYFIEDNMDTIVKCCMNEGEIDFAKYFGEGNFEELADITTDCLNTVRKEKSFRSIVKDLKGYFNGDVTIYDIAHMDDLKVSKATEKYIDCFRRAEKVISKIEAYKREKDLSEGSESEDE